jgi:aldose 1-epimerase
MITAESFGEVGGRPVTAYTLRNAAGMQVRILDYGAILSSVLVPDRGGRLGEVCLGYDDIQGYLPHPHFPYLGAVVGRFANRIGDARFTLDGVTHQVTANLGAEALHGGTHGFDKAIWQAHPRVVDGQPVLALWHKSPHGDQGFPGNLTVLLTYTLTANNALQLDYKAFTDQATVVNLTNHAYFNLSAGASPTVLDHRIRIDTPWATEVDDRLLPTSKVQDIRGTGLDFTEYRPLGERIVEVGGYDHNFMLENDGLLRPVAWAQDPVSGRQLRFSTTRPAMQFYSAIHLKEPHMGRFGQPYGQYGGFCFEDQHAPDSPNRPEFPSTVLRPGELHWHTTKYDFSIID